MPSYKLIYFDGRGRAELARLLLTYGGEKFEDHRLARDAWPALKPNSPWGGVPILEVDGKQLAQSNTIARYLARKYGLAGSGEWEQALVESVLDTCEDLFQGISRVFKADESKKEEEGKNLREKTVPETLDRFEKFIAQNGSNGHVIGNKMTLADLALTATIDQLATMKHFVVTDLQKWPKIKEVYDNVRNDSKLANYIKNRKESQF